MPDLSNALISPLSGPLPVLRPCDASTSTATEDPAGADDPPVLTCRWSRRLRFPISTRGTCSVLKRERKAPAKKPSVVKLSLATHVDAWVQTKVASGVPESNCFLPFLSHSPKMVQCPICSRFINPGEKVQCSVTRCRQAFHRWCAKKNVGISSGKPFKCPQHVCSICKQKNQLRCVRCIMAVHSKCSPWDDCLVPLPGRPGRIVCWRHHTDWRLEKELADPTSDVEEAFCRLPLPYIDQQFKIGSILKDVMENNAEPAPYVHIKRNIYLIKKKRDGAEADIGCTNCKADSTCSSNCECRGLSVSCSKACRCSDSCRNRPFRREKKVKTVKTRSCGWGVEAIEAISEGDFVVEYIGEVIDDALCEQRLWDMKRRGGQNFYMCEVRKDFTIDATFKGNASRFLNHSCDPNCKLEKWQVDGETRVGVFAARSIEVGEPLTYDYRFELFGPVAKCCCGASNCRGFLGSKRKTDKVIPCWGCKKKRTSIVRL